MTLVRTAAALMAATFALGALAAGNTTNEDFRDSKKMLERKVYFDHRVTPGRETKSSADVSICPV